MTGMLASVNSLDEAALVLGAQVDIIDLKQPEQGALGALETGVVRQIVTAIDHRCPVSATVGDLPMQPELVFEAVKAMAETGVDYIKIGFFPGGDWTGTVAKLSALTRQHALIAVLFADAQPDLSIIAALKNAGFKGAMLDTMDKQKGSLVQVMDETIIGQFVAQTKACQLLCGLAGSLRLADIAGLMPYQPDYLGFRGALCQQYNRTAQLDTEAIARIRQAIVDAA
ncbi:(5-formylfuran-3-yl)methyl phosphate synthase [Methylobacter luteus]|uniref:(5-formylfuran-3-yl)methyl phosphate synthase n=1 Tax=Methylobacter luteus TaxID=415 RepID=UPI000413178D|nr:(5-formylfuran-3-yl)methyl phosphate synthase [Methylobacter luteus]